MLNWLSGFIDSLAPSTTQRSETSLHQLSLVLVGIVFVLGTTLIVAFDTLFPTQQDTAALRIGSVSANDIRAPYTLQYESDVLTVQQRDAAATVITPIYNPPDPTIARQQVTLLQRIIEFVDNIRRDPFGTLSQKTRDLESISALSLSAPVIEGILALNDEGWRGIAGEATSVLERVMREPIREAEIAAVIEQLPSQISLRFDPAAAAIVVALVQDVIRSNRFVDVESTTLAREAASNAIPLVVRSFERGQVVVRAGARLEAVDYEALQRFGLLEGADRRAQMLVRALIASLLVLVLIGLYLARFPDAAYMRGRFIAVLCVLFLLSLLSARLFVGVQPPYYIYPAAGLALLLVVIAKPEIAVIGTLAQAILIGLMANNSLEIATLVIAGGMVGALILRRTERLNSYFVIGALIAVTNVVVVTLFNLDLLDSADTTALGVLIVYGLINGILAAMVALVGMYVLTFVLNLPTSLRLVELSQPNHPLLQRMLREAPGTYQHSLQVANLCEQAANAIGANAELIRVAALYHDIGKMLNPAFFVENQADNLNAHDALNDPYRSASIIIGHVTEGNELARQYRLPVRVRDFILEHHGTTKVGYFYARAVEQAGEADSVDVDQFTYPGPKPQSRETAIMMLADGCESTVRARKPINKLEITEIVDTLFTQRMRDGQLDEADLTLRDLDTAREIFVEMLQAVFHPRINYPTPLPSGRTAERPSLTDGSADAGKTRTLEMGRLPDIDISMPLEPVSPAPQPSLFNTIDAQPPRPGRRQTVEIKPLVIAADDEDMPLEEVPPLRRTGKANASDDQADDPDLAHDTADKV
ncbi:MAG: HDIG domain-containing protein [Chloroflexota bacterium]|nr:HDIG domain-containing protein [Chloroflexota bacterium]